MAAQEEEFFNGADFKGVGVRTGMPLLRKELSATLLRKIAAEFPQILRKLDAAIAEVRPVAPAPARCASSSACPSRARVSRGALTSALALVLSRATPPYHQARRNESFLDTLAKEPNLKTVSKELEVRRGGRRRRGKGQVATATCFGADVSPLLPWQPDCACVCVCASSNRNW